MPYILKLSVCLIAIWLFYQLVLRRLTFYIWNRWYLLVCSVLAFALPFINISPVLEKNNLADHGIVSAIPAVVEYTNTGAPVVVDAAENTQSVDITGWIMYVLAAGIIVLFIRLVMQFASLMYMRKSARLLLSGPVKVYQVDKPVIPFSFGNAIFINQHQHEEPELKEIIRHEFIHVKQRHSIDMLWSEVLCMLAWYNPFAWLLRKAIRQNLEFIADQQVLRSGFDKKQYQYLLLRVTGVNAFSIASNFNFSSLKKRIAMMNKVRTARVHLVRFVLLLPVVAVILLAFREAKHQRAPLAAFPETDTVPSLRAKALPENVIKVERVNQQVIVRLKDGTTEKYNLDNEKEKAAFEKKYGAMPAPPKPPVPPAAGAAPGAMVPEVPVAPAKAPGTPAAVAAPSGVPVPPTPPAVAGSPAQPIAPAPPTPPTPPVIYDFPDDVSGVHMSDNKATINLKNGKTEVYDLNKPEEKKKFNRRVRVKSTPALQGGVRLTVDTSVGHTAPVIQATAGNAYVAGNVAPAVTAVYAASRSGKTGRQQIAPASATTIMEADRIYICGEGPGFKEMKGDMIAEIRSSMSRSDLEKLQKDLAKKGFELKLDNTDFNDDRLTGIKGKLSRENSACDFAVADFSTIVFYYGARKDGSKGIRVRVNEGKVIIKTN